MVSPPFYTKENKKLKDCWIPKADIWAGGGAFKKSFFFKKLTHLCSKLGFLKCDYKFIECSIIDTCTFTCMSMYN